jgi:hypothetical protein
MCQELNFFAFVYMDVIIIIGCYCTSHPSTSRANVNTARVEELIWKTEATMERGQ